MPKERSAAMSKRLEEQRRDELSRDLIEGCREMADVYLEIEREYHPLEEEAARLVDGESTQRR